MLDSDLAMLYEVETKMLNRAVRRNQERFPEQFMFQLTGQEAESLRYQIGTSKEGPGGRRYLPYVFTEHGVVMLSAVLNSARAVRMSIAVVQAFVRLREMIAANKDLAARVEKLEQSQRQTASILEVLVDEIDSLKALPPPSKRKIGFDL
jgi:phage regulator Rha-like protein